jgi:hypothetical protein
VRRRAVHLGKQHEAAHAHGCAQATRTERVTLGAKRSVAGWATAHRLRLRMKRGVKKKKGGRESRAAWRVARGLQQLQQARGACAIWRVSGSDTCSTCSCCTRSKSIVHRVGHKRIIILCMANYTNFQQRHMRIRAAPSSAYPYPPGCIPGANTRQHSPGKKQFEFSVLRVQASDMSDAASLSRYMSMSLVCSAPGSA